MAEEKHDVMPVLLAIAIMLCLALPVCASAYTFDPDDFATQVIDYTPGTGIGTDLITGDPFTDPGTALGRPTIDTTGDGVFINPPSEVVTVVPVYQAFRSFEVVTLGNGGSLTVKFNRKVFDDPFNPFGLDFTVFGNAASDIQGGGGWTNGDPDTFTIGAGVAEEQGTVEVSQDGATWLTFGTGPSADTFAPSLGREYDPDNPAPGQTFWGDPTDPTLPLDPTITEATLTGMTLTEVTRDLYEASAGGTSFDIDTLALPIDPLTGLKWFRYVRVTDPAGSGTVEIDALADVAPSAGPLLGDANNDGIVDGADYISVQTKFGNVEPGQPTGLLLGDANDEGAVDGSDLISVQTNFGNALGGIGTAVPLPEPNTLAALGLALALSRVGRKRG